MQKLVRAFLTISLITSGLGVAAQVQVGAGAGAENKVLGVDTRVLELLENETTRPVLEEHLPNLAKRLQEDFDLADYFWDSTLRDLSLDDNHVRGFDEELLQKLADALAAAQSQA